MHELDDKLKERLSSWKSGPGRSRRRNDRNDESDDGSEEDSEEQDGEEGGPRSGKSRGRPRKRRSMEVLEAQYKAVEEYFEKNWFIDPWIGTFFCLSVLDQG